MKHLTVEGLRPLPSYSLQLREEVLREEVRELTDKIRELKEKVTAIHDELRAIKQVSDERASSDEPRVSDHAMLRLLERVGGFDVEKLRQQVLSPERKAAIKAGASSIRFDKHRLIVKGGTVVTVLGDDMGPTANRGGVTCRSQKAKV